LSLITGFDLKLSKFVVQLSRWKVTNYNKIMRTIKIQNTHSGRNWFDALGSLLGWFSVIGQFFLMLQNRQADVAETIIRFFSFFTILTNILVALYFTSRLPLFNKTPLARLSNKGTITALTSFILVVGLVYQIILRGIWEPKGFQIIIDELLHSVIPIFVLLYWVLYMDREDLKISNNQNWLWYPALYFVCIIIRGHFSNFYPYPFINVFEI
jgi:hypothetical protein